MFIITTTHKHTNIRRNNTIGIKKRTDKTRKITIYYGSGNIKYESWLKNGKQHRLNAHAAVIYFENGNIYCESWYKNGKLHRLTAPAMILYFENGTIQYESWFKDGNIID
jgi:antitoxin component YwqK of YwqJK toxin-antitoxin module